MNYRIEITEDALNQLSKFPRNIRNGILKAIRERLSENPHRFKPLVCNWKGFFRLRIGDYRVIYKVEEERVTVVVVRVAPRGWYGSSKERTKSTRQGNKEVEELLKTLEKE